MQELQSAAPAPTSWERPMNHAERRRDAAITRTRKRRKVRRLMREAGLEARYRLLG